MSITLALLSALFAGLTAILAKIGIQKVDSTLATALRTIIVLLFAWLMVFITGSQSTLSQLTAKTFVFLVLSGLATGASWLCYFKALQIGDVNKVVPIDKSSTVLTMLLAFLLLSEPLSAFKVMAMLLIGSGTLMMIEKKENGDSTTRRPTRWLLYAVLSAVFASLTAILAKIGIENVESNLGTAIRTVVVAVMAWVIVLHQGTSRDISGISKRSWVFLILSGIATGLSWLCYYRALQLGDASIVVPIDKLSILVTVAFGYVVFRERLTRMAAAGLVMIVSGTLILLL